MCIPYLILIISSIAATDVVKFTCQLNANTQAKPIIDHIKEEDSNFLVDIQPNVVLVLGITGSGTTTLTSLITAAELEAIETKGSEDAFRIVDNANKIGDECRTAPKTTVPDFMIDTENSVVFYDCPGFSNSREVKAELARHFTIRKLLYSVESVKVLFTIPYEFLIDQTHFLELLQHIIEFIIDIDKYRDGIALVVTKVPNADRATDNKVVSVEAVADILQKIKSSLAATDEDQGKKEQKLLFIDALLAKSGHDYARIGIIHRINEAGPLSKMPQIQSEKGAVLKMVNDNLAYIQKDDDGFGYRLSDGFANDINDVVKELQEEIIANFAILNPELKRFVLQQEKEHAKSLTDLIDTLNSINEKLLQISSTEPKHFKQQFIGAVNALSIGLSNKSSKTLFKYLEFLDFLQLFSNKNLTVPIEAITVLAQQKAYVKSIGSFYVALGELRNKLSHYRVQQRANEIDGNRLLNLVINDDKIKSTVADLEIKSTIDSIDRDLYARMEHAPINKIRLNVMQSIWRQSMHSPTKDCSIDGKRLTAKGYNVVMSDIIKTNCWPNATVIEIFALHKVFIDSNIEKPSIYLSIISPEWEIVTNDDTSGGLIQLNGVNGTNFESSAKKGQNSEEKGKDGEPGVSGGDGGQLFAIAQIINEKQLEIFVSGGNGGDGQDGGNGMSHSNNALLNVECIHVLQIIF